MKKLLTLFIFLLSNNLLACVCGPIPFMERSSKADFIATAKVINVSEDAENKEFHNIQIEILQLFKGPEIDSLILDSRLSTTCAFYTPKNTNWLIFANKGKDGKLYFGYCSGTETIDKKFSSGDDAKYYTKKYTKKEIDKLDSDYLNKINSKIQVLEYIKNHDIKPINEFNLRVYFIDDCVKNIRGYEEKSERLTLYELTINKDLSVENVIVLKELDNHDLALKILDCAKNKILVQRLEKDKSIPIETKIIVGLYYYPAIGKRASFISYHSP